MSLRELVQNRGLDFASFSTGARGRRDDLAQFFTEAQSSTAFCPNGSPLYSFSASKRILSCFSLADMLIGSNPVIHVERQEV